MAFAEEEHDEVDQFVLADDLFRFLTRDEFGADRRFGDVGKDFSEISAANGRDMSDEFADERFRNGRVRVIMSEVVAAERAPAESRLGKVARAENKGIFGAGNIEKDVGEEVGGSRQGGRGWRVSSEALEWVRSDVPKRGIVTAVIFSAGSPAMLKAFSATMEASVESSPPLTPITAFFSPEPTIC